MSQCPGSRRLLTPFGLCLIAALALALGQPIGAQPLSSFACLNGGPNLAPFGMTEFLPADSGTPMLRHTLSGPRSRCNDGTPAVMYIRPAAASYNGAALPAWALEPEKWVILLLGGGGCADPDDCAERWCRLGGFDRGGKMSTAGAYDAIFGLSGIFRRNPALNDFAGYHQVVLYYCSSDNWIGSGEHLPATTSAGDTFDIEFNGEAIFRDAISTLLAGPVGADTMPSMTYYGDELPPLTSAGEILLVGDSAGAGGVRHHLDRLRQIITAEVSASVEVYGVVDAGFSPGLFQPGITFGAAPGSPASYVDHLQTQMADRAAFWGVSGSALDRSCHNPAFAAAHNAVGSHPEICLDTRFTQLHHITTPIFLRQDINDTLLAERYANWQLYPTRAAYWAGTAQQLQQVLAGPGLEVPASAPGVFGPKCGVHVSLLSNSFFSHRTNPAGSSYHDLLANWLGGLAPSSQIQQDFNPGPPFTPSLCP